MGDPGCYLVAERIMAELGGVGRFPNGSRCTAPGSDGRRRRPTPTRWHRSIAGHGLQPLRLPSTWPPDTELAMRVATYAKGGGRAVAFSLAAFRQVFAGGRDLGDEGTVLIAAAACEMHPTAVLKGVGLRSVERLAGARGRAGAAGRRVGAAGHPGRGTSCSPASTRWSGRPRRSPPAGPVGLRRRSAARRR